MDLQLRISSSASHETPAVNRRASVRKRSVVGLREASKRDHQGEYSGSAYGGRDYEQPPCAKIQSWTRSKKIKAFSTFGGCRFPSFFPWVYELQLQALPLVIDQAHSQMGSPAMVVRSTILDDSRTAAQVACQFEFDPLHHPVPQFSGVSENRWKFAGDGRES